MDYQEKLKQLYRRKNNLSDWSEVSFSEKVQSQSNDALRYILASMEEVEENYRENTKKAAYKVVYHLSCFDCEFRLQGSVTTKTEIKQNSDIDLVVITNKAYSLEEGLINNNPYQGDLTEDLKNLRYKCEQKIKSIYSDVNVNKAKSIEVHLANPKRKVDVVVANYYETYIFQKNRQDHLKGIYLYDKKTNSRVGPDFPFLRTYNINYHLSSTSIKKIVRFLKNIIKDFEIKNLNSFQVNAIAYNLTYYNQEIDCLIELKKYLPSEGHYKCINSPCGKEEVKINHNPQLEKVLDKLIYDASNQPYSNEIY